MQRRPVPSLRESAYLRGCCQFVANPVLQVRAGIFPSPESRYLAYDMREILCCILMVCDGIECDVIAVHKRHSKEIVDGSSDGSFQMRRWTAWVFRGRHRGLEGRKEALSWKLKDPRREESWCFRLCDWWF